MVDLRTKKKVCEVCGATVTGAGVENLRKNFLAHLNNEHDWANKNEELVGDDTFTAEEITKMSKKQLLETFDGDDISKLMSKKQIIEAVMSRED